MSKKKKNPHKVTDVRLAQHCKLDFATLQHLQAVTQTCKGARVSIFGPRQGRAGGDTCQYHMRNVFFTVQGLCILWDM